MGYLSNTYQLWDVVTDQLAVDLIKDETDMAKASEVLVKYAIHNGSRDNVSVTAVLL
jgi:protein phosphatase PTC1